MSSTINTHIPSDEPLLIATNIYDAISIHLLFVSVFSESILCVEFSCSFAFSFWCISIVVQGQFGSFRQFEYAVAAEVSAPLAIRSHEKSRHLRTFGELKSIKREINMKWHRIKRFCIRRCPFIGQNVHAIPPNWNFFSLRIPYEAKFYLPIRLFDGGSKVFSSPNVLLSLCNSFYFIENILMIFFFCCWFLEDSMLQIIFLLSFKSMSTIDAMRRISCIIFVIERTHIDKERNLTMLTEEKNGPIKMWVECVTSTGHLSEQKLLDNDW